MELMKFENTTSTNEANIESKRNKTDPATFNNIVITDDRVKSNQQYFQNEYQIRRMIENDKEEANSDRTMYTFKMSGIGNSWLIGTDVKSLDISNFANAFNNGVSDCPEDLTIPSTLTDENGEMKSVEIIGQYAFYACADKDNNGKTRKVTLTKQVKVIKYEGLGLMDDLEEFTLQDGSVLETIETGGLEYIGLYPGQKEVNRVILTLPSTLSSVNNNGIYWCDLFNVIIYCGSHPLSNSSLLENVNKKTVMKVLTQYPSDQNIFGRTPDRNSEADIEERCNKMEVRTSLNSTLAPSYSYPFTPHSLSFNYLFSLFASLLPSRALF